MRTLAFAQADEKVGKQFLHIHSPTSMGITSLNPGFWSFRGVTQACRMHGNDQLWWPYVLGFLGQPWFQIFCPIIKPCVRSCILIFDSENMVTIWQTNLHHCGIKGSSHPPAKSLPYPPRQTRCFSSAFPRWLPQSPF